MRRSEVSDIDHPGNALAVVGAALSTYGVLNVAAGASNCEQEGGAYCTGVFLPLGVGIPLLIGGLVAWNRSKDAANNFMPPMPGSSPVPPAASAFDFSGSAPGTGRATVLREKYREAASNAPPQTALVQQVSSPEPLATSSGSSKAQLLRERYRASARAEAVSSSVAASAVPAVVAGFQTTRWGMSQQEVLALYPGAQALGASVLGLEQPVAGSPARIKFEFRSEKLARVSVSLMPAGEAETASEVLQRFRDMLVRKYGAPASEGEQQVTWKTEGTHILLRGATGPEFAASLTYENQSLVEAALDEI